MDNSFLNTQSLLIIKQLEVIMDSLDKKRDFTSLVNKFVPLIFENCNLNDKNLEYEKYIEKKENYEGTHLFVISHGLKGEAN